MDEKKNSYKKLALFDIDGTVMYSGKGARRSLSETLMKVFGKESKLTYDNAAGQTDRIIIKNLMTEKGISEKEITARTDEVSKMYIQLMHKYFNKNNDVKVYNGIPGILEKLSGNPDVLMGLVTGNIRDGAKIKLGAAGLWDYFKFGAFGDDAFERNDLPGIAVERAYKMTGIRFEPQDTVIIGDTAKDVICGKHIGARTVVVVRFKQYLEEIEKTNPDHIFFTFENEDEVIKAILGN